MPEMPEERADRAERAAPARRTGRLVSDRFCSIYTERTCDTSKLSVGTPWCKQPYAGTGGI